MAPPAEPSFYVSMEPTQPANSVPREPAKWQQLSNTSWRIAEFDIFPLTFVLLENR
jgi:hypothetical protein